MNDLVLSLPMRDGNRSAVRVRGLAHKVLSLPMRDGNKTWSVGRRSRTAVLSLPMRDGNSDTGRTYGTRSGFLAYL